MLFLVANNPIVGVLNIWSNGTLVWSSDPDVPNIAALQEAAPWGEMLVGPGDAAQLPFAAYEAGVGVDNAVAYRGRGTVMITSLQLGSSGQLPNLTFEIASGGTYSARVVGELGLWCDFSELTSSTVADSQIGPSMNASSAITPGAANAEMTAGGIDLDFSQPWRLDGLVRNDTMVGDVVNMYNGSNSQHIDFAVAPSFASNIMGTINWTTSAASFGGGYGLWGADEPYIRAEHHIAIQQGYDGVVKVFYDGIYRTFFDGAFDPDALNALVLNNVGEWHHIQVRNFEMPNVLPLQEYEGNNYTIGSFAQWGKKLGYGTTTYELTIEEPTLEDEVARLCALAGLAPSQYDVTALVAMGRVVRSMAVAQVSSARAVLDLLGSVYFFEAVLSDKIYFRPRAGASAATITWADLGYGGGDREAGDPLPLMRSNELEIPSQIALTYTNVDDIFQPDTQYSQRLLGEQVTTSTVQVPIGFTATEAKAAVDAMLVDGAVGATTTTFSLSTEFARLEPTDVVTVTDEDGGTLRVRLVSRSEADGVLKFTGRIDDASVFTQAGVTVGGSTTYTEASTAAAFAAAELMDIPLLNDADDRPGFYAAAANWPYDVSAPAVWTSARVYYSRDDVDYDFDFGISNQSVLGITRTTLPLFSGGNVFDHVSTVTVDVKTGELSSVTREALLNDRNKNLALIGSEIVQFQTATLVSPGIYTLSVFLRHRLGTEWARGIDLSTIGHRANERFVLLETGTTQFESLSLTDLNKIRYYKALGRGFELPDVEAMEAEFTGQSLKPLAPVDLRRSAANGSTTFTWNRRSRYAGDFFDGMDIPLGEEEESYLVEVYYNTLYLPEPHPADMLPLVNNPVRSTTVYEPRWHYTQGQMLADFWGTEFPGYQATLVIQIRQVSALYGPGEPLQNWSLITYDTSPIPNSLLAHLDGYPVSDSSTYGFASTFMGVGELSATRSKFGETSLLAVSALPYTADNGVQFDTNTTAFSFGTGDFTVEFWMYCATAGYNTYILGIANAGVITSVFPQCLMSWKYSSTTNTMEVLMNTSGAYDINFSVATWPAAGSWVHAAITRKAGVAYLYANGVLLATAASTGSLQYQTTFKVQVGYSRQSAHPFLHISELRIIKEAMYFGGTVGVARFTPPIEAFT